MIRSGIRIHWHSSIEYIEIDLENLQNVSAITSTLEWWKAEKQWVKYNTTFQMTRFMDGSVELDIAYEQDNNRHLDPDDICFGHAVIRLSPGQVNGDASWEDFGGPEESGISRWERVDNPLIGNRKRQSISKVQREQEKFRGALMAVDECCVLTGESTKEALEAAHIIPVKDGGAEVIENGIILRADIHRLFDAGFFYISPTGKVVVTEEKMTNAYLNVLNGKELPQNTLARVQVALELKNSSAS